MKRFIKTIMVVAIFAITIMLTSCDYTKEETAEVNDILSEDIATAAFPENETLRK